MAFGLSPRRLGSVEGQAAVWKAAEARWQEAEVGIRHDN